MISWLLGGSFQAFPKQNQLFLSQVSTKTKTLDQDEIKSLISQGKCLLPAAPHQGQGEAASRGVIPAGAV